MGQTLRQDGLWDGIVHSAWMPDWYMGDPTRVYYPPLTVWLLGLLTAAIGDVFVAFRVLVSLMFLALGLSVYGVGVRWGRDRWLAAAGAIVAITAPYTLRTVFVEGNLPRGLAILPFPWIVWHTERILADKHTARSVLWLALLWAATIIGHVMQAYMFGFAMAIYVVLRALGNVYIPLRRGVLALAPAVLGAAIVGAYLVPAYSHSELGNVPYLPAAKVDIFSIEPSAFLPNHDNIEAISIGIALAAWALLVTLRTSDKRHVALLVIGAGGILLAFGPDSGLFRLVPLNGQLLPERFLNVTALVLPLVIATTPIGAIRRRWMVLALLVVLAVDARPAWRAVHMRDAPPDEKAVAVAMSQETLPGRVAPLTLPNPRASLLYLTSDTGEHPNVSGWALENTPHHGAIRRLLAATEKSPDYVSRVLALWQTDYVVARFEDDDQADALRQALGFEPVMADGSLGLWERPDPAPPVQILPDDRMLVIGDNASTWLFAFPFASEGTYPNPDAYDAAYLSHFSVIGLNRVAEGSDIEDTLEDWVRAGNTLIVDLSGLGRTYDEGYTLFGVHALPLAIEGDYDITWPDDLPGLPATLPFTSEGDAWIGATYFGLEDVRASLTHADETYPILAHQTVGEGQVWFVGFNIFYLLEQTQHYQAMQDLARYLVSDTGVDTSLALPPLPAEIVEQTPTRLSFTYTSDAAVNAIVSMTYFPRWQATVDDAPVAVEDHEHLIQLALPAGTHRVTLAYHPFSTTPPKLGWAVSIVALVGTVGAAWWISRRPLLATEDRTKAFDDRLPQVKPAHHTTFARCPSCGFRLAESGPPNEKSYPFASLDCAICGFSLGKADVVPDTRLGAAAKRTLALDWMRRNSLSEDDLRARYGLGVSELFGDDTEQETAVPPRNEAIDRLEALAAIQQATAAGTPAPTPTYATCPNCGFRMAYGNDPQSANYAVDQRVCPVCEYSPDSMGLLPQLSLPANTKLLMTKVWLRRHNLTEREMLDHYQLTLDDLFLPEALQDTPPTEAAP